MNKNQFVKEILPLNDMLYRFAYRMLQDSELAKDIVQNAYLKLWDIRKELAGTKNKQAFAMRMVQNACLDKIKLRKVTIDVEESTACAEPTYDNIEAVELVKQIICKLPENQKGIIWMRDVEGFSFELISEIMKIPLNNIRVSLSIARKKVREELKKLYSYGLQQNK